MVSESKDKKIINELLGRIQELEDRMDSVEDDMLSLTGRVEDIELADESNDFEEEDDEA